MSESECILCCSYINKKNLTINYFEISGNAIKCYQCNSYFQQDCADYFNNKSHSLVDCGPNVTMCRKIVQEGQYLHTCQTGSVYMSPYLISYIKL